MATPAGAATNNIFTVAGTLTGSGSTGDGGPATAAKLNHPWAVAATADGGFLIADQFNNVVRRVSPAGMITTVAGTLNTSCLAAPCGDGGPATSATLVDPEAVAATADGGFLIADGNDEAIRRVSPTGTITTVAGTITASGSSGDGGPATAAKLSQPDGVAATADGGFLIADAGNDAIRRVSPAGTITTVAGTLGTSCAAVPCGDGGPATAATFIDPEAVAETADGGFLIADGNDDAIRRVSPAGTITTVAGTLGSPGSSGDGGPATAAKLRQPDGVAVTADGGFLIADSGNGAIRRVSPAGTITTVAGMLGTSCAAAPCGDGGPATAAKLGLPNGVTATADGGVLIADTGNSAIRRVSPAGTITTVAGTLMTSGSSGDGGPATAAKLNQPIGVAATPDGGFLIADSGNSAIRRVSPAGTITTVAGTLMTSGSSGDGGPATAAKLNQPTAVAATADGGFLIADAGNSAIRRVSPTGRITTVAGTLMTSGSSGDGGPATAAKLNQATGVAATADGGFLIVDQGNHAIRFVDADLRPGPSGPPGPQGA
ncbi:MAG TPA: hypothetical protein VGN78_03090, partial [Solirubrobacteraceae bacterium]|nr:hypothetical protein [Solirubrobacteraceae bacterium]